MQWHVQEAAEQMMGGLKASDLRDMDADASDAKIRSTCFTSCMLKMRVNEETYNDETRVKVSVTRCADRSKRTAAVAHSYKE